MAERQILPYPRTKSQRQAAQRAHRRARENNLDIPHFIRDDGTVHYWDNKGGGNLGLNNLGIKLSNEAARLAKKKGATPTKKMFIDAYGSELGEQLFNTEKEKLKMIYTRTPSATHDIDHINSMASGGVHHSGNLRMQNNSTNRSEGARGLSSDQKRDILVADTPEDQIRLQGPKVTPRRRQQILQGATPRQHNRNPRRVITRKGVATFVPQQGWEEQMAAPRIIDTDPLAGNGLPISGV